MCILRTIVWHRLIEYAHYEHERKLVKKHGIMFCFSFQKKTAAKSNSAEEQ